MSAQSVIQIDVDDAKFKQFQRTFDLYQNALKTQPAKWSEANKAAIEHASAIDGLLAKLEKHQKQVTKEIAESNQKLKDTVKMSGEIAINFASAALSMAKWVTLGALGGGFGIGAIAANASGNRREARGLGISTGDLRAAKTDLSRYIDPESTLNAIADIKNDPKKNYLLRMLGVDPSGNPADMLPQLMKSARSIFNKSGQNSQIAQSYGLNEFFSPEALRSMGNTGDSEFNKSLAGYGSDRGRFANGDSENKAMEDFWIALKGAGETLETTFIKALAPLAPQLVELSNAVAKAISDFIGSKEVKHAIQEFTAYIGSAESKKNMQDFFDGLSSMGKYMLKIGGGLDTVGDVVTATGKGLGDFIGFLSVGKWDQYANPGQSTDALQQAASDRASKDSADKAQKIAKYKNAWDAFNGVPAAERYNNPGDLSSWGNLPKGKLSDGNTIAQFSSVKDGMTALEQQLLMFMRRDHLTTIDTIMSKYVGADNPRLPGAIAAVSRTSGFSHDQQLSQTDIYRLMSGVTKSENAQSNFSPTEIRLMVVNSAGSDLNVIGAAMK